MAAPASALVMAPRERMKSVIYIVTGVQRPACNVLPHAIVACNCANERRLPRCHRGLRQALSLFQLE